MHIFPQSIWFIFIWFVPESCLILCLRTMEMKKCEVIKKGWSVFDYEHFFVFSQTIGKWMWGVNCESHNRRCPHKVFWSVWQDVLEWNYTEKEGQICVRECEIFAALVVESSSFVVNFLFGFESKQSSSCIVVCSTKGFTAPKRNQQQRSRLSFRASKTHFNDQNWGSEH